MAAVREEETFHEAHHGRPQRWEPALGESGTWTSSIEFSHHRRRLSRCSPRPPPAPRSARQAAGPP
eukprot:1193155-Prymnesium_polylepis.1